MYNDKTYTIGKLANIAKIKISTIRYYERKQLIFPTQFSDGGYRLYDSTAISRIIFIQKAQEVGFTLAEIKELIKLQNEPNASRAVVKSMTKAKLDSIQQKISVLKKMHDGLAEKYHACSGIGNLDGCPIINAFS